MRRLTNIRAGEGRNAWAAFSVLFVLISSHSVLETARDALFLADISATNLPWVYLAIAALSLIVAQLQARFGRGLAGRSALTVWTATAALVTAAFWLLGSRLGVAGLYALYIWSGLLTTLVLVHFWILVGDLFSVTQAKRLYGLIGAGSVAGAIAGSAIAGILATTLADPTDLLAVTAGGLAIAAALPFAFARQPGAATTRAPIESNSIAQIARLVASKPYAMRVVVLLLVAAAAVTVADFLFKSTVAANVAPEQLGAFFASTYLALNVLSLAVQLFLVSWLVRRFSISIALSVLPLLLVLGGGLMIAAASLTAALVIKGADGSLRYSLHRTSTELLFVPLSAAARRRIKAFVDVVSQRGGQAIASIAILSLTAMGLGSRTLAVALVATSVLWLGLALTLHRHYLDIFRRRLDRNSAARLEAFPSLDLGSLETLIAALDSADDSEVLTALDVLDRERRARLVPALILYHPSEDVVLRALELFTAADRAAVVPLCDRLIENHDSERVRAAAVAARSVLAFDEQKLRMCLSFEESEQVRTAVMVNLIAAKAIVGSEAVDTLESILRHGGDDALVALAEAIGRRKATDLADVLNRVAASESPRAQIAAANALAALGRPEDLDALVELLGSEGSRATARRRLVERGELGLDALERALASRSRAQAVRWQLPAVVAEFDAEAAVDLLLRHLPDEWDGMLRYRSVRALELIAKQHPNVQIDRVRLDRAIDTTIARSYRYLDRRLSLERGARDEALRGTTGHELLSRILGDKEKNAIGRVFRLLGLAHPGEDFESIYRSVESGDDGGRADALELVENILPQRLRRAVAGLIDDQSDIERLAAGSEFHRPKQLDYNELLDTMLASSSATVQDVTAFHIGELKLTRFTSRVVALANEANGGREDLARVAAILSGASHPVSENHHGH